MTDRYNPHRDLLRHPVLARRECSGFPKTPEDRVGMIGWLQFRALPRELVDGGKMTNRAFHDAILQSGSMPVEMVRARWKFEGERPGPGGR